MTSKKKLKEAQKQAKKLDTQRATTQEKLAKSASFIERFGVHIITIIVATGVCLYIALNIPKAFEMWNDGSSSLNNLYIYGLIGITGVIWLCYVVSAIAKMLKNRN